MSCHACGAPTTVRGGRYCARCLLMAAVGAEDVSLSGTEDAPPCELLSLIGETPRATTFLAEQTWPLRRLVAFKLFKDNACCAWIRSSEGIRLPRHPGIGHVIESGRIAGRTYVMTHYFAGGPITHCYDRHQVGLGARVEALVGVSAGLAFAHGHGIVHGHLAVTNELCEPRSPFVPRLVDFNNAGSMPEGDTGTLEAITRADLDGMIERATALLSSPIAKVPRGFRLPDAMRGLRAATRSADDLHDRLQHLHAQIGSP